ALSAIGSWNRPQAGLYEFRTPRSGDVEVSLRGSAVNVRRGDQLLFVAEDVTATNDRWQVVRAVDVTTDPVTDSTLVRFAPGLDRIAFTGSAVFVHAMRSHAALFGYNAPNPLLFEETILTALEKAKLVDDGEWAFAEIVDDEVLLDGLYDGVEPDGWAVLTLRDPATSMNRSVLAAVDGVQETANSAYAVSARVTALSLKTTSDLTGFVGAGTRKTIVSFRSEALALAPVRVTAPLAGGVIPLAEAVPAAAEPRRVLVRGRRARAGQGAGVIMQGTWPADDPTPIVVSVTETVLQGLFRWLLRPGNGDDVTLVGTRDAVVYVPALPGDEVVGEVVTVTAAAPGLIAALTLVDDLVNVYDRQGATAVELFGNVVAATHGESVVGEVLGSGDGTRAFQRFVLRRKPVTYVPAPTPTGGESTLEVRVNGVLWHEVPGLFGRGPRDRVYTTSITDSGVTELTFGDGVTGARLPTGVDNVVARYRAGLGLAGAARADQITLALTRPLGLKAVTNPLPAGGGQDAQAAADARFNAPRSVLTLGRVVALQDYADFAAEFSGVAKATATWTWDGSHRGVVVTVAASDGRPVPPGSPLLDNLRAGILRAGDSRVRVHVLDFLPARFAVRAYLRVAADFQSDVVRAAVTDRLLERYGFDNRSFGEGVSLSGIVQVIHDVAGVTAVRVERLHREDETVKLSTFVAAEAPRAGEPPGTRGAEILTLSADRVEVEAGW
ncbi:MAG: putative baseplate assembly protein, partial [Mycetocola sp.]